MGGAEIYIVVYDCLLTTGIGEKLADLGTQYGIESEIGSEDNYIVFLYLREIHLQATGGIIFVELVLRVTLFVEESQ